MERWPRRALVHGGQGRPRVRGRVVIVRALAERWSAGRGVACRPSPAPCPSRAASRRGWRWPWSAEAAALHVPVAGSIQLRGARLPVGGLCRPPPAPCPSRAAVAVWLKRGVNSEPVGLHVSVAGSYSSALRSRVAPSHWCGRQPPAPCPRGAPSRCGSSGRSSGTPCAARSSCTGCTPPSCCHPSPARHLDRSAGWRYAPPGCASSEDALSVQVPTVSASFRDTSAAPGACTGSSGWHPPAMDARPASNNDKRVVFMCTPLPMLM